MLRAGFDPKGDGMLGPIVNPRRTARLPLTVRVEVEHFGDRWTAETLDVGPCGLQLVAPEEVVAESTLTLRLAVPGTGRSEEVAGRVAWCSPSAPWRLGIAFERASLPAAARWFEQAMRALPGLPSLARVPERLEPATLLFLAPPPRFLLDFSADELDVIRALRNGGTVGDLRVRLEPTWAAAQRALFSLMARRVVCLRREEAGPVAAWDPVLRAHAPVGPAPVRPITRSADAHEAYLEGTRRLAAGQASDALPHLRRALTLAPGDAEVAGAMGRALAASSG